jgi:glycosyltransferase involved in cell wall biosynthesis
MKFVFASYVVTPEFKSPEAWIKRIRAYGGVQEALNQAHEVVSIEQIDYEGEYLKNGVNYKFIRLSKSGRYFPRKLHRYIQQLEPDVVVIQGLHFPLQLIQLRWFMGNKVKIIVQNHAEKPFDGLKKCLQRWADHYADAYLFASSSMGMDWIKRGNLRSAKKIHEVMEVSSVFYPLDKAVALAKTGLAENKVFLWVGRLNTNKGPLTVIKAFLKFAVHNPGAKLYMIYHTSELLEEINNLLDNNRGAAAIVLVGKVPNDELLYWYNSADFIVSGSHYEGSGTAICEAMSCGCIPVVTSIFSFQMITDNGNCGVLYEAGNEAALLAALIQTQQMDIFAQRNRSLAYFKANLSFAAIAQRFQEIAGSL